MISRPNNILILLNNFVSTKLTFVVCTFAIYAVYRKVAIFQQRIFSPFLLLIGLIWLQIGPAFEIGNHFYVNDWELRESISDMINASFSFFNFGAQNLISLSLRKKGVNFLRKPNFEPEYYYLRGLMECVVIVLDVLFVVTILIQPALYNTLGRDRSSSVLSPLAGVAGILTLFRLWFNLGPNPYTKWGGIFFLVMALLGVGMFQLYKEICNEIVHIFIGGSFVCSVIPFSVALWNIESLESISKEDLDSAENINEETGEKTEQEV